MPKPRRELPPIWRILALLVVVGISVGIFLIPTEQTERLAGYGYVGIFLIAVIAYATVFLPAPAALLVLSMGAHLPPLGLALSAGSGAAIGELSGYLAGFGGQTVIENIGAYKRMAGWMQRNGPLTVFALAAIPNPLFDLTGIAAGALRMPVAKFLLFCWLGQVIKMFIIASIGGSLLAI